MKIIIYSLNFKPELVGVGKYTGELADYLNDRGHTISVITSPKYYPEWLRKRIDFMLRIFLVIKYIDAHYLYRKFQTVLKDSYI